MKRILAIILTIASVFSVMTFTASAEDSAENTVVIIRGDVEYIFDASTSEDLRESFIADCENEHEDDVEACSILCTLLGHEIESSTVAVITHKVYSTDPRCVRKTYRVESCTRCDYSSKTLKSSVYISCC